jgi:DNA-binding transcriptional LysR family regulator
MDKLRAMSLFVRVAELRSFSRVADETQTSKSLISKEISRLERELGARLLQRSTRHLALTQVGEGYLVRCREILLKLQDAEHFIQDTQGHPAGKLKVNAPMALGLLQLGDLFSDFMRAYPDIELDIHLSDEPLDLIDHGFDLGFRISSRRLDSNYIGRPLAHFSYRVCAAPSYLERCGAVTRVEELKEHNCFVYSYFQGKNLWPLGEGVAIGGNLRVNNTIFMMEVIRNGLGIGFIPDFICAADLASGAVVEILPDVDRTSLTLFALYPARTYAPPKLTRCVEFFERWYQRQSTEQREARV